MENKSVGRVGGGIIGCIPGIFVTHAIRGTGVLAFSKTEAHVITQRLILFSSSLEVTIGNL